MTLMDMLTWKWERISTLCNKPGDAETGRNDLPQERASQANTKSPEIIHMNTGNVTRTEQVVFMY